MSVYLINTHTETHTHRHAHTHTHTHTHTHMQNKIEMNANDVAFLAVLNICEKATTKLNIVQK